MHNRTDWQEAVLCVKLSGPMQNGRHNGLTPVNLENQLYNVYRFIIPDEFLAHFASNLVG